MTTFLAITVTFLFTLIVTFIGTLYMIISSINRDRRARDYWRGLIEDYSDYDEKEES